MFIYLLHSLVRPVCFVDIKERLGPGEPEPWANCSESIAEVFWWSSMHSRRRDFTFVREWVNTDLATKLKDLKFQSSCSWNRRIPPKDVENSLKLASHCRLLQLIKFGFSFGKNLPKHLCVNSHGQASKLTRTAGTDWRHLRMVYGNHGLHNVFWAVARLLGFWGADLLRRIQWLPYIYPRMNLMRRLLECGNFTEVDS